MALFTSPLTINDGVSNRIFNWLRQIPNRVAGLYDESAATAYSQSKLEVSHLPSDKTGRERHLLKSAEMSALLNPGANDPADSLIECNITVVSHPKADPAEVKKRFNLALAAANQTGFLAAFIRGTI